MLKQLILATYIPCDARAYGLFHIGFFLCGLIGSILLSIKLKKLNSKQNDYLLLGIGIFLALNETYKELYFYYLNGSYNWSCFPFQLCDMPMYLCIISFFLKPGIIKNTFYYFMSTFTLFSGFISFVEPSGLLHDSWPITINAFVWHMLLVFIGSYLLISKRINKRKYNFLLASILFIFMCYLAFIINCLFWNASNGQLNNFFIGPANSSIIIFKQICEASSWIVSTILYIPSIIFVVKLVSKIIYRFY